MVEKVDFEVAMPSRVVLPSTPPSYFFWFTEVCWQTLRLRPAWNKRDTCVFFWESEEKLYPLLFFLFSLQQKPNSTSLPAFQKMFSERLQEAVAGLVWLARRLGLHHPGDVVTKIRLCTVYCVNSKLQRWNDNILYDCWIQILQIPWIRQSLLESSDSSSGDWTRSKEHAIARWIGWRPQCCQEFMVCCFSGAIWRKNM